MLMNDWKLLSVVRVSSLLCPVLTYFFSLKGISRIPTHKTLSYFPEMGLTFSFATIRSAVCKFLCVLDDFQFEYCLFLAPIVFCENQFEGGGWVLVRRVKQGQVWHQATDHLRGTHSYGGYGTPTSDFSFSLAWSTLVNATEFLFITGALDSAWSHVIVVVYLFLLMLK